MTDMKRRSVLGAAAWLAPTIVVATTAPAFAASSQVDPRYVAQREGANFRLKVEADSKVITSVVIGGVAAKYDKQSGEWVAKIQKAGDSTQFVQIYYSNAPTWDGAIYFRE